MEVGSDSPLHGVVIEEVTEYPSRLTACAACSSIVPLLVCRFLAGACAS